jgi:hypothetical protein
MLKLDRPHYALPATGVIAQQCSPATFFSFCFHSRAEKFSAIWKTVIFFLLLKICVSLHTRNLNWLKSWSACMKCTVHMWAHYYTTPHNTVYVFTTERNLIDYTAKIFRECFMADQSRWETFMPFKSPNLIGGRPLRMYWRKWQGGTRRSLTEIGYGLDTAENQHDAQEHRTKLRPSQIKRNSLPSQAVKGLVFCSLKRVS